jgi:hypothetical protein
MEIRQSCLFCFQSLLTSHFACVPHRAAGQQGGGTTFYQWGSWGGKSRGCEARQSELERRQRKEEEEEEECMRLLGAGLTHSTFNPPGSLYIDKKNFTC